jgi:outer membrane lipoprotein-sorting protein
MRVPLVAGLCVWLAATAAQAQTAEQIVKRSEEAMKALKTWQATIVTSTQSPMGNIQQQMEVKTIPGKKMAMTLSGGMGGGLQVVDDGTNMWLYMPSMKQYQKNPSQIAKRQGNGIADVGPLAKNADLKLLKPEKVDGKETSVVQIVPKNSPATKIKAYFDKSSGLMVKMEVSGAAPAQGNQPGATFNSVVQIKNMKLNAPIAPSAFKFTPPAGAKQMQPGMGGPGGAPVPAPKP